MTIRCERQALVLPKRKGGSRGVFFGHAEVKPPDLRTVQVSRKGQIRRGWRKLDGSQCCQVHPRLTEQYAVRPQRSSRERTWQLSFLGCRIAAGPCRSQSRWDGKMGVKWSKKGAKWRLLREHATLLFMTQLLYCHAVALIVVQKSAERQMATTIYSLRTCVENMVSQIFKKAEKCSIP